MPSVHVPAIALLCAVLLAACGDAPERDPALPGFDGAVDAGAVEWRGRLPCADCEAIDTRLVLERRGDERVYALVEVFVAAGERARFEETGEWRMDDAVLSLDPGDGGVRHYGLVHGGALQVRDARGQVYPGREHDLLLPACHP